MPRDLKDHLCCRAEGGYSKVQGRHRTNASIKMRNITQLMTSTEYQLKTCHELQNDDFVFKDF